MSNINNIDIKDIDPNMPLYDFIGKTIEKLIWRSGTVDIKFTDGTYGALDMCLPGENASDLRKLVENGKLYIAGGLMHV